MDKEMSEREAFEDWFFGQAVEPTSGDVRRAWEGWQAASKRQRERDAAIILDGNYWNGAPADVYETAKDRANAILNQGSKE